jgi:hypothetical protein
VDQVETVSKTMHAVVNVPALDVTRTLTQLVRAAFPFSGDVIPLPRISSDEWIALAQTAQQHGLAPLLYASLEQYNSTLKPPSAVTEMLELAYYQTKTTNWLMFQELGELLARFEQEQIPVVLLKGAALANTLYPRIALRPMGDLDMLIYLADAPRVRDILTARGLAPGLEPAENFYPNFSYDQAFERCGERPLTVEAHWHLFKLPYYQNRIPIEWFWQRTMPMRVNDQPARLFTPEAQIVHLAAHAVLHHHGDSLLASYDLALVLVRYRDQINWEEVIASAHSFGLSRIVDSNLARVRDEWGVFVPDDVCARLAHSSSVRERILFAINTAPRVEARDVWDGMNLRGVKAKLLYFCHTLFPSHAYMRKRYGIAATRALPLHYLRRLSRGAGMFVHSAVVMAWNVVKPHGRT